MGPCPGRVASPPGGGQAVLGRHSLPPPRPFQMRLPSGQGGSWGPGDLQSACRTLPRRSFNRCSRGQETKRRRGCGRQRQREEQRRPLSGLTGRLTTGPLTSIRLSGRISRGSGPRNKGCVCSQSGCLVTYQGSRSKGKEKRPLWLRPPPPGL